MKKSGKKKIVIIFSLNLLAFLQLFNATCSSLDFIQSLEIFIPAVILFGSNLASAIGVVDIVNKLKEDDKSKKNITENTGNKSAGDGSV